MAENRAAKSGLAAEAQDKLKKKYDPEQARDILAWVQTTTGESFSTAGDQQNVYNVLGDGYVLGKLAIALGVKTTALDKLMTKRQTMTFKKMEVINCFIEAAKQKGVADHEVFQTVDLTEQTNINQVVICLQALGRKFGHGDVKEATQNKRHFTEEQLNAGKNVIGLQYGTNKGANQSGQNFGRPRHIVEPEPR